MAILDNFPPPSLDPSKWSSVQQGTTALQVGFPENGCFVHGVDDHGDHVYVSSEGKFYLPANRYFSIHIFYSDIYSDPEQDIRYYFGYRSNQKDGGGDPLYGIDVMLSVEPGPSFVLQKRVISAGVVNISNIVPDPLVGGDGGFRVVRNGTVYSLYRYDGSWIKIDDVDLGFKGAGYVQFGVYAEDGTLLHFPWVAQT